MGVCVFFFLVFQSFLRLFFFFFFNDTATTEIYTLSLHDALPISRAIPSSSSSCPTARCCWTRRFPRKRSSRSWRNSTSWSSRPTGSRPCAVTRTCGRRLQSESRSPSFRTRRGRSSAWRCRTDRGRCSWTEGPSSEACRPSSGSRGSAMSPTSPSAPASTPTSGKYGSPPCDGAGKLPERHEQHAPGPARVEHVVLVEKAVRPERPVHGRSLSGSLERTVAPVGEANEVDGALPVENEVAVAVEQRRLRQARRVLERPGSRLVAVPEVVHEQGIGRQGNQALPLDARAGDPGNPDLPLQAAVRAQDDDSSGPAGDGLAAGCGQGDHPRTRAQEHAAPGRRPRGDVAVRGGALPS